MLLAGRRVGRGLPTVDEAWRRTARRSTRPSHRFAAFLERRGLVLDDLRSCRSRTGSRRSSSRGATTPGSSSPRCRPARRPAYVRGVRPVGVVAAGRRRSRRRPTAGWRCCRRRWRPSPGSASRRPRPRAVAAGARSDVVPLLPAPYLLEGAVAWRLLHDRTREVVRVGEEPSASETDGVAAAGRERERRTSRGRGPGPADAWVPARWLRARPQPRPMTLDGTNTWVLREPGARGPSWSTRARTIAAHLDAVLRRAGRATCASCCSPTTTPTTPRRARAFAERVGCGVRALDPAYRLGTRASATATWSRSTGSRCGSWRRPGTPPTRCRSCCRPSGAVLTGDTVLGRGTTVVAHPDGQLGAYLDSLDRLHGAGRGARGRARSGPATARSSPAARRASTTTSPTGGSGWSRSARRSSASVPPRARAAATAVPDGSDARARCPAPQVVEIVYADVDPVLWPAAELSVRAQLDYLRAPDRSSCPAPRRCRAS